MIAPLGAHVSTSGGLPNAAAHCLAIGATAAQIFTKQAQRWKERDCDESEVTAWRAAMATTAVRVTASHDSYLINVASPDETLRRRSIESYVREMQRSVALGLNFLCSHPGCYTSEPEGALQRNADAIVEMLERVPGPTMLLLETTVGAGSMLGGTFEELARLIDMVPPGHAPRIGICADTCHLFAAGYDLVGDFHGVWQRFDDVLGLPRLRLLHLNDSKFALGSRRDRHELIGEGTLGEAVFRRIMNDDPTAALPKVIETPKGEDPKQHDAVDARMLERLRSYIEPR